MILRISLLCTLMISLSACSSFLKKDRYDDRLSSSSKSQLSAKRNWKASYVGQKGYLKRPPILATPDDHKNFKRCSPIEIVSFRKRGKEIILVARQGQKVIQIAGLNRKKFRRNSKNKISQLDHHFVKSLKFIPKRNIASASNTVCAGQLRKNMSKKEFLFVSGDPEKINKKSGLEEWFYKGTDEYPSQTYYFSKGNLYSWK